MDLDKRNSENNSRINEGLKSKQPKEEIKSFKKIRSKKVIESEIDEENLRDQIRNPTDKKIMKNYNANTSKKELEVGERELNSKGYYHRKTTKIKTDQYTEIKEKLIDRKVKIFS